MKSRIAIASSIAALTFVAAPAAAFAASAPHQAATTSRVDPSRDISSTRHLDRSADRGNHRVELSRDFRDW